MGAPLYFDSHCHLQDDAFDDDRAAVLARARATGVREVVVIGTGPEDAEKAAALAGPEAEDRPAIWYTAGLHPHDASCWSPETRRAIEAMLAGGAIAVGEIGLDFHYDNSPRKAQHAAFAEQLEIAARLDLPVVIHSRDAERETLDALAASPLPAERVVLHCFSSSRTMLEEGVERGYYVSFSGLITFRGFPAAEQVPLVPADRVLVETDAPYLAPTPHRGKRNEPAFVVETARALGKRTGVSLETAAARSRANARRFYGLD